MKKRVAAFWLFVFAALGADVVTTFYMIQGAFHETVPATIYLIEQYGLLEGLFISAGVRLFFVAAVLWIVERVPRACDMLDVPEKLWPVAQAIPLATLLVALAMPPLNNLYIYIF